MNPAILAPGAPIRLLTFAVKSRLHRLLRTGNRRFEFERAYLEHGDPWNYAESPYERLKYQRTLEAIPAALRTALEVGCGPGVFTALASPRFDRYVAADVSSQAIAAAKARSPSASFVVGDLRRLKLGERFDLIFCAEVLCYIPRRDAGRVRQALDRLLAPGGQILYVTSVEKPPETLFYFDQWARALEPTFSVVSRATFDDPKRPYEIVTLAR